MDLEWKKPLYTSTAVDSFAFEPIKSGKFRGNIHVQFRNKDGDLTSRGYFMNVQRSIFLGLEASMKPGAFIIQTLKGFFEWRRTDGGESEFDGDLYNNPLIIPANCDNTIEAIDACKEAQRITVPKEGLFQ